jgi:GNAT superfamily N-acetyltransferase
MLGSGAIVIRPSTVDLRPALEDLFARGGDGDAHCAGACAWRWRAKGFSSSTVAANRAARPDLADRQPAVGLVALDGEQAIGSCSVGPRADYHRFEHSWTTPRIDRQSAWSMICLVVRRTRRGQGVARALIDAALAHAAAHGAPVIEGYPTTARTAGRPRVVACQELT